LAEEEIQLQHQIYCDGININGFDCEESQLNDFIYKEVSDYHNQRLGITYLFYHEEDLVGFVTISMADIRTQKLPLDDRKSIHLENYPAIQIGQLAVDKKYKCKKIGKKIIQWCLKEAIEYSAEIGCRFLVLNALPTSVGFYEKCHFKELKERGREQKTMYTVIPQEMFVN
jgi:GNAT superfamily N-acetyltransferase